MSGDVSSNTEKRLQLGLQAACAVFLVWLYVGDLLRLLRAPFAEVAVLHELPSVPLSLVGSAVAVTFAVTLVLARRRPAGWRPRRLAVIAAVLLIFVDFLVLASRRSTELPELELAGALNEVTEALNRRSTLERVPTDPRGVDQELSALGPVPLFVRGARVPKWSLEVRRGCTAPDPRPAAPGTFVYCVTPDATRGWVTVSATEGAATFGAPGVIGLRPPWVGEVTLAEPPPPEPPEDAVWQPPTPDEP